MACFSNTRFTSCNHSNPSVLVAGKLHSQTKILANTGTHLEGKQLLKNIGTYSAIYTCYTSQGRKHPLLLCLLEQAANVHWFEQPHLPRATPTSQLNYCDLFFAMLPALANFTKVKFTENIALRCEISTQILVCTVGLFPMQCKNCKV